MPVLWPNGALALLATASTGMALWLWWGRWTGQRRRLARARRAAAGEAGAARVLKDLGYRIEDSQLPTSWQLRVDGRPLEVRLRADYLVTRGGRRYVAEVKTGSQAPRLENSATRRQLLEYRLAYGVNGVLLVDMEAGKVQHVEFPGMAPGSSRPLLWLAAGLTLGVWGVLAVQRAGGLTGLLAWVL